MVSGAIAIENDFFDSLAHRGLGRKGTQGFCAGGICGQLIAVGCRLARSRRSGDCDAGRVINKLDVDVFVGETNAHPRAIFGAADLFANTPSASLGKFMLLFGSHRDSEFNCLLNGLAFLANDAFVGVAHAFAFIWFGGIEAADFRSYLANGLAVRTFDG